MGLNLHAVNHKPIEAIAPAEAAGPARQGGRRVLMVCIEPTPYVQGLVAQLVKMWRGGVDVVYLGADLTQSWSASLDPDYERVLPRGPWRALSELGRLVVDGRHGLVQVAGWSHPIVLTTLALARWRGVPVVVDTDTPKPHDARALRRTAKRAIFPALFRLPVMFLAAGTRQAAYLGDYGVPERRIRVAGMTADITGVGDHLAAGGAELRLKTRARYGIAAGSVLFVFVGRLLALKGIRDLIQAFESLRRTRTDVELLVVGDGPLRACVTSAAGPGRGIHYAGRLSGEALWAAYGAGDALVLPSHSESWGLVVNEAMAAGLPVIASDRVGCVGDLVRHCETGLVFPAGSVAALEAAMVAMAARDPRAAMSVAARKLISGWTFAAQAERTTAAWREAMAA